MQQLKRMAALLLVCTLTLVYIPRARATAYNNHPRLVIILVLDQFRADYIERYRADFKNNGFNLFLDQGAWFPDCYYDYANTKTAPGHAAIGTGAYTDGNGIGSNQWWDLSRNKKRPVSSVEDGRFALIGLPAGEKNTPGASPRNLLASTIGDELRLDTEGKSEVWGISLNNSAAILPAGATANGAFWIDPTSGRFITSSYYMPQLPAWAETFDDSGRIAQARQEAGTMINTGSFYNDVGPTTAAVGYELDFAKSLITGESLGKHNTTDMLIISISSTEILNHRVGPNSPQMRGMVDAVDVYLNDFFGWLDKNIPGGLGNVWIALTADHGVAPVPAEAARLGLNAADINVKQLAADVNYAMNLKFSPGEKLEYILPDQSLPYLALNPPEFTRVGISETEAEDAVQKALPTAFADLDKAVAPPPPAETPDGAPEPKPSPAMRKLAPVPQLFRSYTRVQMATGLLPETPFGRLIAHSYTPNGGWYVMVIPNAFQMQTPGPPDTGHYSPYSYDRHVPLAFYGVPFQPGVYRGRVQPVDIAATFASLLGVNQPSASVGQILTQALKPASAIKYPEAEPQHPRTRRQTHRRIHHPIHKSTASEKKP